VSGNSRANVHKSDCRSWQFWRGAFVALSAGIGGTSSVCHAAQTSVEIVEYFAGKDELCLEREQEVIDVVLRRLIVILDNHGEGDFEVYCTLVTAQSDGKEERKFSASASSCRPLFLEPPQNEIRLQIVDDHVCEVVRKW
jgi:hypothetical protein